MISSLRISLFIPLIVRVSSWLFLLDIIQADKRCLLRADTASEHCSNLSSLISRHAHTNAVNSPYMYLNDVHSDAPRGGENESIYG